MYRLLLRFKIFPIWNWLCWPCGIQELQFLSFGLNLSTPLPKEKNVFGSRQKDFFFFFYSIKYLKSYHILCFFLTWAMTFLYSCFILSDISNYLSFSWILCFIISAFPSCHPYFLFHVFPFFTRALCLSCSNGPIGGSLESCTAVILGFLSTAPRGWVSLFPGFPVFFLALFPL